MSLSCQTAEGSPEPVQSSQQVLTADVCPICNWIYRHRDSKWKERFDHHSTEKKQNVILLFSCYYLLLMT